MRRVLTGLIPSVGSAVLLAACGSSSSSSPTTHTSATATTRSSAPLVKTTMNAKLGTILVTRQGLTLYRLTGNGKFICTSSTCLQVWPPLRSPGSTVTGAGVAALSTVKRPDGTVQVTYKGWPLYTFSNDHAPDETNGEGVKLGGDTWLVATTSGSAAGAGAAKSAPPASSSSAPAPSGTSTSGNGY